MFKKDVAQIPSFRCFLSVHYESLHSVSCYFYNSWRSCWFFSISPCLYRLCSHHFFGLCLMCKVSKKSIKIYTAVFTYVSTGPTFVNFFGLHLQFYIFVFSIVAGYAILHHKKTQAILHHKKSKSEYITLGLNIHSINLDLSGNKALISSFFKGNIYCEQSHFIIMVPQT